MVEKVLLRLSDTAEPIPPFILAPSCQGESILPVTPDGHTLLVDAGGLPKWMHSDFDLGEQVVLPIYGIEASITWMWWRSRVLTPTIWEECPRC